MGKRGNEEMDWKWSSFVYFRSIHALLCFDMMLASSPGSPSPFLTFSRARILYAKNRRRGRAWYGTSPTRSRARTSLTDNKDYLGEKRRGRAWGRGYFDVLIIPSRLRPAGGPDSYRKCSNYSATLI